MRGIINRSFDFIMLFGDELDDCATEFDLEDISSIKKGEEVEILKVVDDPTYLSGVAYVIFNPENNESLSVDSDFVDLIGE